MPDRLNFTRRMPLVDVDQILGPDRDRRYLRIHKVDVAPEGKDTEHGTTLTLRGLPPTELNERIKPLIAKQVEKERIRKLFNRD